MGRQQQLEGASAENHVKDAIGWYDAHGLAWAQHLPVAFRQVGKTFIRDRVSPFDFMGRCRLAWFEENGHAVRTSRIACYANDLPEGSAVPLAMELKSNRKGTAAMKVVPKGRKGDGLKHHQLEALANWHAGGGLSMILWRNGDRWLRLLGEPLSRFLRQYDEALLSKSIPATIFEEIPVLAHGLPHFLEKIPWRDGPSLGF